MKTQKLLIISKNQFGYHIDTYYYCKLLKQRCEITYLCWDHGLEPVDLQGINVRYVSRTGNKVSRYRRLIAEAVSELRKPYDLCFIKYFAGCSILKLARPNAVFILDVRTGMISESRLKRIMADTVLRIESSVFRHVTAISSGLAKKLRLPKAKTHILPLGADTIATNDKSFGSLKLLYVGTLYNRNIHETILGFEKFYREFGDRIPMNYKILGCGYKGEEAQLAKLVKDRELDEHIEILGQVPHEQLKPFFEMQNLGISYIPMTPYFDCQPPTKTFEYVLSGMPVIATATAENKAVISALNGVLIEDNPDSFYEGLKVILENRNNYNARSVRETCKEYTWENIVQSNLQPYFESILAKR